MLNRLALIMNYENINKRIIISFHTSCVMKDEDQKLLMVVLSDTHF